MRFLVRPLAVGTLSLGAVLLAAGPALASPPVSVTGQVTDQADVLSGSEESEVQSALDELQAEDGTQLYVVYVDSFDGVAPGTWASQSFDMSALGNNDVLFAVATEDQRDAYYVGPNTDVTEADLSELISNDVEPDLGQGDWATAAVTLADGIQSGDASSGGSGGSGDGGGGGALAVLLGIAVVGGGGYAAVRSRRRKKQAAASARAAEERAAAEAAARDPHHGTSTEQLTFRASEELLEIGRAHV